MTDFERGVAMFQAGEKLPEWITPEMKDLSEGYNTAWLEVQPPYTQGFAAFQDGAPCPCEPEAKRGWWDAREEYHGMVQAMNAPTEEEEHFSWWEYFASRGEFTEARRYGRW